MEGKKVPLVSVITTVFKTEKYLPQCIESVLAQTYENIQLIVVDDCSPGNAAEIAQQYAKIDNRVELVTYEKNRGLFHARLAGAAKATGEYIMFIDSDDYIGIDYVRCMVQAAEENHADIVKAQFVSDYNGTNKTVFNYIVNQPKVNLNGNEILAAYFDQEGRDFSYHTIWNKLYSKTLWDKCRPYYDHIEEHLIMAEDFAYSTPLMAFANHLVEIDNDTYFYLQRTDASTGIETDIKKFEKSINDLRTAFDFVEWFLCQENLFGQHSEKFLKWRELYGRFWVDNINNAKFSAAKRKYLYKLLKEALHLPVIEQTKASDNYTYSLSTPWNETLEKMKQKIADPETVIVSFDLFDTLVVRPFLEPKDLFYLLEEPFKKTLPNIEIPFYTLRVESEAKLREETKAFREDVTLEEIYDYIAKEIGSKPKGLSNVMECEKELEIRHCYARKTGKALYELALSLGKKVCISSDMYLPKETIIQILQKNGFCGYDQLFLSCECGASKRTGNMYRALIAHYAVKNPGEIVHIGDTWDADVVNAQKLGIEALFLPKATEVYRACLEHGGLYGGRLFVNISLSKGYTNNNSIALNFWSQRAMFAIIANRYFDNPFRAYRAESDFNSDPFYMGYGALGMHLLAICFDLQKIAANKRMIHFVSRDGYICKKVYDRLAAFAEKPPKSNYLQLSRKAILPIQFVDKANYPLVASYLDKKSITNQTPAKILTSFFHIDRDGIQQIREQYGVNPDKNFLGIEEFERFISACQDWPLIGQKVNEYVDLLSEYFSGELCREDILFDLGYGGTSQMLLSKLLHMPIDGYYVYVNKEAPYIYSKDYGYSVHTLYPHTPAVSGAVREFFFSEANPSCVGYIKKKGKVEPEFECDGGGYATKRSANAVECGALEFVDKFLSHFGDQLEDVHVRSYDLSLPFEFLMERCSDCDKFALNGCTFEDDVFWGESNISLYEMWRNDAAYYCNDTEQTNYYSTVDTYRYAPKWKKLIFLALFDRATMKAKIKKKFTHCPILLSIMRGCYSLPRAVYHIFR